LLIIIAYLFNYFYVFLGLYINYFLFSDRLLGREENIRRGDIYDNKDIMGVSEK